MNNIKASTWAITFGLIGVTFMLFGLSAILAKQPPQLTALNTSLTRTPQISTSTEAPILTDPKALPIWVISVYPYPGMEGPSFKRLCIELRRRVLWEPGDYENHEFRASFGSRLTLQVDHLIVPSLVQQISFFDDEITVMDNQGTIVGTYSSDAEICYEVAWTIGEHIATFTALSTSGAVYTVTWLFKITSTDEKTFWTQVTATEIVKDRTATISAQKYYATETAVQKLDATSRNLIYTKTWQLLHAHRTLAMIELMSTIEAKTQLASTEDSR
jgi:hypothetical protein